MSEPLPCLKILLIEDNPGDVGLIEEMLAESQGDIFEITHFERLTTALSELRNEQFDVCLLDLSLPDSQGLDTFIRLHTQAPQLPIVVLSGLDDDLIAAQTMREGAQDYLVKGYVEAQLLIRSLYYAMERQRLLEELTDSQPLSPISSIKQLPHYQHYIALSHFDEKQANTESQKSLSLTYQQLMSDYLDAIQNRKARPSQELKLFTMQLAANQTSAQQLLQLHLSCLNELARQSPPVNILANDVQLLLVELLSQMMEFYRLRSNTSNTEPNYE